jgi:diguanylate cyclase (GGDEF)-like protein
VKIDVPSDRLGRSGLGVKGSRLYPWPPAVASVVHLFGLDRIKQKILVFALVATLIPSLTLGWQSYAFYRDFTVQRISEELRSATFHAVREFTLWLRERFYEMRVLASSYEVTENAEHVLRSGPASPRAPDAARRLAEYLRSVRGKLPDYEALSVVSPTGQVLATSREAVPRPQLPADWVARAKADAAILGEPYRDEARQNAEMVIAVPIVAATGASLGVLAAAVNFEAVERLLRASPDRPSGSRYLVRRDGTIVVSADSTSMLPMKSRLPDAAARALFATPDNVGEYADHRGTTVIGVLRPLVPVDWGVVAEIPRNEAYAQIGRIRNRSLLLTGGLLLVIGVAAYGLALTIVRPLDRLTAGAGKVAGGDLAVDVPVLGGGEVAYMTRVFNHMVSRLREGRDELNRKNEELKQLSVTDGLTGLYNRKHLTETLAIEVQRARRFGRHFSVLMIDVDHFKRYNDAYGHPVGDQLLIRAAACFREATRSVDYAARYGGEEFLIILHEVGPDRAVEVANRVREHVAAEKFGPDREQVTISIGVASFPEHADTADALVAMADAALYAAKDAGRNRVAVAAGPA